MRTLHLITALAGLMGAAGVALAARAAHGASDGNLMSAAMFLLIHATALAGLARHNARWRDLVSAGMFLLALGTLTFSGDLALRGLAGIKLFTNAAPVGGMAMILGWLAIAGGSLAAAWRGAK